MKYSRIEQLRFSDDDPASIGLSKHEVPPKVMAELRKEILANAMLVTPEMFPTIAKAASAAVSALDIAAPEFFVLSNPEVNAKCAYLGEDIPCAVILHSGLIERLTPQELQFVIGHELGHYIFRHGNYIDTSFLGLLGLSRLSYHQWQRACEISADRVGLVSVNSEADAISAIIKIASGLPANFIRFDALAYQKQAREILDEGNATTARSSHPMVPIRARALHWFVMSEAYYDWRNYDSKPALTTEAVDEQISKDLSDASLLSQFSGAVGYEISTDSLVSRALLWSLLVFFVADNVLSKSEQKALMQYASKEDAEKAIEYVKNHGAKSAIEKQRETVDLLRSNSQSVKKRFISTLSAALYEASDDHLEVKQFVRGLAKRINFEEE